MYLKQLNRPANDFVMIPRAITTIGLSAEAMGLLLIVAAHHGDEIRASQMSERMKCGKDKRQRVLRELRDKGLLTIERRQTERGNFTTGYVFDWDSVARTRASENLPNSSAQVLEKPEPENPAPVKTPPEPENPAPGLKTRPTGPENPAITLDKSDDVAAASQRAATSSRKHSPEFVNEFLSERKNLLRKQILPTDPPKGLR